MDECLQGEKKMEEEIVQQVEGVVVDEPRYHLIPKMPKSIAKAINDVMKDIKTLQKNSENKFQNYNYVDIDSFLKSEKWTNLEIYSSVSILVLFILKFND